MSLLHCYADAIDRSVSKSYSKSHDAPSVDTLDVVEKAYRPLQHGKHSKSPLVDKNEHEHSISAEQLTPLTPMTPLHADSAHDLDESDDENEFQRTDKHVHPDQLTAHTLTDTDTGRDHQEEDGTEYNLPKKSRRSFSRSSSHSNTPNSKYLTSQHQESSDAGLEFPDEHKHDDVFDNILEGKKSRRSQSLSLDESRDSRDQLVMEHLDKFRHILRGAMYGQLVKFQGDDVQKIHKIKKHHHKTKFVVYVPQKQLLFYSKDDSPNDTTTMISVKSIQSNDAAINTQLAEQYRGNYFQVIGLTRSAMFASESSQNAQLWMQVISASLSINMQLIEPYITLKDQYYIDGWLAKYQGSKKDNIKFAKGSSKKYVIFIPALKILYFCGEKKSRVKTTLVRVRRITRKNQYIQGHVAETERDAWFKVIGESRIVLFCAESTEERDIWFDQISQALSMHRHRVHSEESDK